LIFPIVCIAVGVERPAARGFKRKKEKRLAGKKEKIKSKPERNFKLQQFGADRTKHQNFEEEEEEEAFKGKKRSAIRPANQPTNQPTQIECVSMLSCYGPSDSIGTANASAVSAPKDRSQVPVKYIGGK
jgi:hypothetical protein